MTTELAAPEPEAAALETADEETLLATAREAISSCNWIIGQCAAQWTERYASGRTDRDFGEQVGLSGDQVYQRRRVWETFADVRGEYPTLRWSHYYAALTWADAPESLGWAEEMGATVAEMRAWRRAQHGEDLSRPAEEELPPFEVTSTLSPTTTHIDSFDEGEGGEGGEGGTSARGGSRDEADLAVARSTGEGDYTPFRSDARGEAAGASTEDDRPLRPLAEFKKIARALERMNEQLSPQLLAAFHEVPGDVQDRVLEALGDVQAKFEPLRG